MPSADFCRLVRMDHSTLSPESGTNGRSPEVSSTAFGAQSPGLQPVPLMDMDFAVTCPLVRHRMPPTRFLSIGSRLCSTLLSDPVSRRRPCASLWLHLHQVVKGTLTPELSNMLGTHEKASRKEPKFLGGFTFITFGGHAFMAISRRLGFCWKFTGWLNCLGITIRIDLLEKMSSCFIWLIGRWI